MKRKPDDSSPYLAPGEVALLLHVSRKTVSRWATLGLVSTTELSDVERNAAAGLTPDDIELDLTK